MAHRAYCFLNNAGRRHDLSRCHVTGLAGRARFSLKFLKSLMKSVRSDETGRIVNKVDKICCYVLLISFYLKKKAKKKIDANILLCSTSTVRSPVSGHKRRKHVFLTLEGLQSAEINTKSSFSIQETGVKLTAA